MDWKHPAEKRGNVKHLETKGESVVQGRQLFVWSVVACLTLILCRSHVAQCFQFESYSEKAQVIAAQLPPPCAVHVWFGCQVLGEGWVVLLSVWRCQCQWQKKLHWLLQIRVLGEAIRRCWESGCTAKCSWGVQSAFRVIWSCNVVIPEKCGGLCESWGLLFSSLG